MTESMGLKVGQKAPSFEIEIYDPTRQDFGTISFDLEAKEVPRADC